MSENIENALENANKIIRKGIQNQTLCPKCKIGMIFLGMCVHCFHEPGKEEVKH